MQKEKEKFCIKINTAIEWSLQCMPVPLSLVPFNLISSRIGKEVSIRIVPSIRHNFAAKLCLERYSVSLSIAPHIVRALTSVVLLSRLLHRSGDTLLFRIQPSTFNGGIVTCIGKALMNCDTCDTYTHCSCLSG